MPICSQARHGYTSLYVLYNATICEPCGIIRCKRTASKIAPCPPFWTVLAAMAVAEGDYSLRSPTDWQPATAGHIQTVPFAIFMKKHGWHQFQWQHVVYHITSEKLTRRIRMKSRVRRFLLNFWWFPCKEPYIRQHTSRKLNELLSKQHLLPVLMPFLRRPLERLFTSKVNWNEFSSATLTTQVNFISHGRIITYLTVLHTRL